MKKIAITGLVIFLVMFVMTCDAGLPNEETTEYTDVVYSEDGSKVTLYLDGVGVPVSKAQRAITKDLAKMAYDYFEVIFIAKNPAVGQVPTTDVIARAQWELGQSAGISGVYRGEGHATKKGHSYLWKDTAGVGVNDNIAMLFVGRKDDKTLLGVGRIAEVDHSANSTGNPPGWADAIVDYASDYSTWVSGTNEGTVTTPGMIGLPNTPYAYIRPSTTSVTFYVEAIRTGLLINDEYPTGGTAGAPYITEYKENIFTDSFNFTGADAVAPATISATGYVNRVGHSHRQKPSTESSALYPIYYLPEDKGQVQAAEYKFSGAASTFKGEIRYNSTVTVAAVAPASGFVGGKGIAIERRFPRYLEGGRYRELKQNIDTDTTVVLDTSIAPYNAAIAAGAAFNPLIPLKFTTQGSGVFSFFIEVPVYMITKALGTNSGELQAVTWKLRTGLGSELYSLDTGKGSGGCVLMGIGEIDLDWLEIYWNWVD